MDNLSIFTGGISGGTTTETIKIITKEGASPDSIIEGLEKILRELKLTRKGHEAQTWGEEVEEMEDVEELEEEE